MKQEKRTAFADCQSKLISIKEQDSLSNHDLSILTGINEPAVKSMLEGKTNTLKWDARTQRRLAQRLNTPLRIDHYPHGKRFAVLMPNSNIHSWLLIPLSFNYTMESWKLATK